MTEEAKTENPPKKKGIHVSLFMLSTVIYGIMAAVGFAIMFWGHNSVTASFTVPKESYELFRLISIAALVAGMLLGLSHLFENWFRSYRTLKSVVMRILGPSSAFMAIYLAAMSAVGEEILFRGAIQPFAGLVLTSVLFGLLHLGHDGKISAWSIWAVIAGLMLGWVYEETGSLLPAIFAHFLVNTISIFALRKSYKSYLKDLEIMGKTPEDDPVKFGTDD